MQHCKTCMAQIIWAKTKSGGNIPLDPTPKKRLVFNEQGTVEVKDAYTSHFETCPDADKHRRKR